MATTTTRRVGGLKPGMGAYDETLGRDIRVKRVEIDGDMAMVWLSNDGREAVPFPYSIDDEVVVEGRLAFEDGHLRESPRS